MIRLRTVFMGCILLGLALVAAHPVMAAGASQTLTPIEGFDRLLAFLANPNIVYLLLVVGLLGVVAEVVTAGAVFPGVTGVICLLLSLYGLLHLPTNWIGLALIAAGVMMFVLDLKITGFALSIGAVVAFAFGSLLIFTPFWVETSMQTIPVARLNPWLIVGTTGGVAAFFLLGLAAAVKAQLRPAAMGRKTLIDKTGSVKTALMPQGIVHVEGEEWSALSAAGVYLPAGTLVRVIGLDGLTLRVAPLEEPESSL